MNVQTATIADAVKHIETLPPTQKKEVFQFIDFLITRNELKTETAENTATPKKRRQAGTLKDKLCL